MEGEERRRSVQGELSARPAGNGICRDTPFQSMGVDVLCRWRSRRRSDNERFPPALSPDRTMFSAGTAV